MPFFNLEQRPCPYCRKPVVVQLVKTEPGPSACTTVTLRFEHGEPECSEFEAKRQQAYGGLSLHVLTGSPPP